MSKWKLDNHTEGKAYSLTKDNMNRMIADIEVLVKKVDILEEELQDAIGACVDIGLKNSEYEYVFKLIADKMPERYKNPQRESNDEYYD